MLRLPAIKTIIPKARAKLALKTVGRSRFAVALIQAPNRIFSLLLPGIRRKGQESLKGFAASLVKAYPPLLTDLHSTDHFGALSHLGLYRVSRLDYAMLLASNLIVVKRSQPGLGLNSKVGIKYQDEDLSGLTLLQTWSLLLNWGHLFGTYATERFVQRYLSSQKCRIEVVDALPKSMRAWASSLIDKGRLSDLHVVLAGLRLDHFSDSQMKSTACQALLKYDPNSADPVLQRLIWVFRRTCQITYAHLQTFSGVGVQVSPFNGEALDLLRDDPSFSFNASADNEAFLPRMLDALDEWNNEFIFGSPESARRVFSHVKECEQWWSMQKLSGMERLRQLYRRPRDWPTIKPESYPSQVRIRIPAIYPSQREEMDVWESYDDGDSSCSVMATPNVRDGSLSIDLYARRQITASMLYWTMTQLATRHLAVAAMGTTPGPRMLWRASASLILQIVRAKLAGSVSLVAEPIPMLEGRIGYAMVAPSRQAAVARLRGLVSLLAEGPRERELAALLAMLEASSDEGVYAIMLAQCHVIDTESSAELTDVDVLALRCTAARGTLILGEHKVSGQPGGAARVDAMIARLQDVGVAKRDRTIAAGGALHWAEVTLLE